MVKSPVRENRPPGSVRGAPGNRRPYRDPQGLAPAASPVDLKENAVHIAPMNFDISHLLEEWDYQPGQVAVRKFKTRDGTEKIQLRVDLGLLQMNAAGRPDGKRPFGRESLFEHFQARLEKRRRANPGTGDEFVLSAEDCAKLQQEAIQYHHRYICLFQLEDYKAVIRDTKRNAAVFDFVDEYAESDELAWSLQQFRPQLLMMQIRARGMQALRNNKYLDAIAVIATGLQELRTFYREHSRHELLEQSGEIHSLETWLQEVQLKRPLSERERLEHALDEAVRQEDYEKAAQVRDALRSLKTSQPKP